MNRTKLSFVVFASLLFAFIFILQNRAIYDQNEPWGLAPAFDHPIGTVQNPLPLSVTSPTSRAFGFVAALGTIGPTKFFLNTPGTLTNMAGGSGYWSGASWAALAG